MKILMVVSEAPPVKSGVARVAEKMSAGLRRAGHYVDVLSSADVPRLACGEMRLSSMALKLPSLRARLREYDVVHLHGPVPTFSDIFLLFARLGLGAAQPRLVYTHHAPVDLRSLQFLCDPYNAAHEWLARLADAVVATTPTYARRLAQHVPSSRLNVIPWAVNYDNYATHAVDAAQRAAQHPFTVVYLGQLRPYKGLSLLLEAMVGVNGAQLWVIGNGHRDTQYRHQAEALGLENVKFLGSLSDEEVSQRLGQAHLIVLPSLTKSEAFGIALLEGMAAGCVPVASHLPGVADVVGSEGFTFPVGNAEVLREIITHLHADRARWERHARLVQVKARQFAWERTVAAYERVFARVLEEPSSRVVGWSPSRLIAQSPDCPVA